MRRYAETSTDKRFLLSLWQFFLPTHCWGKLKNPEIALNVFNTCISKAGNSGKTSLVILIQYYTDRISIYLPQLRGIGYIVYLPKDGFSNLKYFVDLFQMWYYWKKIVIQLTFKKCRQFEIKPYENLQNDCIMENMRFTEIFVEISSYGFATKIIKQLNLLCK